MEVLDASQGQSASEFITQRIAEFGDPARLFNSSLDGNVRRAIDIHEGEEVDGAAFKALIRQAVALNSARTLKSSRKPKS